MTKYSDNLFALVAPTTPLAKATISQELVGKILTSLKQRFDYVVVDTPPAFDDVVLQAFDVSDLLLLVLTLDIPALKNIKVTLETLELLNFPREKCRIVLNRADAKVGLTVNEVETTLHSDIAASIASAREVPASVNRGEPIVIALPRHPVSQTFMTLARDCVAAIAAANVKSPVTAAEAAHSDGAGRRRGPPSPGQQARMSTLAERLASAQRDRGQPTVSNKQAGSNGGGGVSTDPLADLKQRVHQALLANLGPKLYDAELTQTELERMVRVALQQEVALDATPLSNAERTRITQEIADDILGYGPIEPYLRDPDLTEIMVNGPFDIWIERTRSPEPRQRHLRERGSPAPHHRQDRRPGRTSRRRGEPDGGRPTP